METPDLKALTGDELTALAQNVSAEQDRRRVLESIPTRIEELRGQYIECGGDPADLG